MKSEALFARAGEVFNGDASKNTFTEVIQYNVTVAGKVEKSVTFDFKNFKFVQSAVTPNDIEITIDDELFIGLFTSSLTLVDLNSQVIFYQI